MDRRKLVSLLAALVLLCACAPAWATTYYVRTTGNDTTGDGSTGNPWATVSKCITTFSIGGETCKIGPGTYAESTSGLGYARFTNNYATVTTFEAEDPNDRPIITGSTLATYSIMVQGGKNTFKNLVFRVSVAQDASIALLLVNNNAADNLVFENCHFDGSTSVVVPTLFLGNFTGTLTNLTFTNCVWTKWGIGTGTTAFKVLDISGGVAGLTITGAATDCPRFNLENVTSGTISDSTFTSTSGLALAIGKDGDTGLPTTVTVSNVVVSSTGTHAALIGAGAVNVSISGLRIDACGDYGLVIKSTAAGSNNVVSNSVLRAGAGAAKAALYLKGAQGATVQNCRIIAGASGYVAIRITANDSATDCGTNTIRFNSVEVATGATAFFWAVADDNGNNVVDDNAYRLAPGATLGTVHGTSPATLAALRAAWTGTSGADATSYMANVGTALGWRY